MRSPTLVSYLYFLCHFPPVSRAAACRSAVDNSRFVSCGSDKTLIYWDVATGQPIRKLRGHSSRINCVRLNAEGTMAVTGSYDSTVRCWDLKANEYV